MDQLKYTRSCFNYIDYANLEGWEQDDQSSNHVRSGSLLRQFQDNLIKYEGGKKCKIGKKGSKICLKLPSIGNNHCKKRQKQPIKNVHVKQNVHQQDKPKPIRLKTYFFNQHQTHPQNDHVLLQSSKSTAIHNPNYEAKKKKKSLRNVPSPNNFAQEFSDQRFFHQNHVKPYSKSVKLYMIRE